MSQIFTNIILFTMLDPSRIPKNPIERKKGLNDLKKTEKSIKNLKGKKVSEGKVLKTLTEYGKKLLLSNKEVAIGQIFLTAIETVQDMLLHNNETSTLIHYNDNEIGKEISKQSTYAYIGEDYSSHIKSFLSGPLHNKFYKLLFSTQQDAMEGPYRQDLKAEIGVNQRGTVFLDSQTFLSLADLKELCNFETAKTKILKEISEKKFTKLDLENEEKNLKITLSSKAKRVRDDRKRIERRSALLETKSILKIFNRLPAYETHVTIHLACFRTNGCDKTHTIEKLVNSLCPQSKSVLEKLTETQLKKRFKSSTIPFSDRLVTELGSRPIKLECFKDNCKILKSWERTIPSNGEWKFTLEERHKNGVYLNKLLEFEKLKVDNNMPSSFFLIIEHYGSDKASVRRLSDNELISSVYSPSKLAFEYELWISHISKNNDEGLDDIMEYTTIKKSTEFNDESLTDAFYPNREMKFNINMEDILILEEKESKPNAKFKLEMSNSLLESNSMDQMDTFKKILTNTLGKDTADNFTRDDLKFEDVTKKDENKLNDLDDLNDL